MKYLKIFIIYLILFGFNSLSLALDIQIKLKVKDEIITNIDINHEIKYLTFLNPKLTELKKSKIEEIAKNSLITEMIKKKELKKIYNFNKSAEIINVLENNFFKRKKIKNKEEFLNILKSKKINYKKIRKKLQIEGLWNQFIYKEYFKNVKIDKLNLREKILTQFKNKKKKYEYNLSEIVFIQNSNEGEDDLIKRINKNIKDIGFENSANIFSISSTSKNGGLIGWVGELQISDEINQKIQNLKINEHSKPINIASGYLILKMNDKRLIKEKIDIDDQLNKLISQETNRQLNNFSIIHYKKLRKNTEINEY